MSESLSHVVALRARIDELSALVYVPGLRRCAKCELRLVSTNLHVPSAGMSTDNDPKDCPNGCGPMWPVTEREAANKLAKDVEDLVLDAGRARRLRAAFAVSTSNTSVVGTSFGATLTYDFPDGVAMGEARAALSALAHPDTEEPSV